MKWIVYYEDKTVNGGGFIPALQRTLASPFEAANKEEAAQIAAEHMRDFRQGTKNFICIPATAFHRVAIKAREQIEYEPTSLPEE